MAAIVIILGSWASIRGGRVVMEREHDQAVIGLTELLDTVESTASIACFANDEQLAKEVAQVYHVFFRHYLTYLPSPKALVLIHQQA